MQMSFKLFNRSEQSNDGFMLLWKKNSLSDLLKIRQLNIGTLFFFAFLITSRFYTHIGLGGFKLE